jgi:RNA polymerase sigma-70 factor (ECF subfamily)
VTEGDSELLPRLLVGEEEAYRALVSAHHGAMVGLARAIVGDAVAEEVVQEAWLKAMGALAAFEARSSLRVWLLRIVRNEAISRRRAGARLPEHDRLDDTLFAERFAADGHWRPAPALWSLDTPEALLVEKELMGVVDAALGAMPVMQRAVLTLKDVEGLSFEQVCNILDISSSNARVLLHRARRRLWAAIEAYQVG